MRIAFDYTYGVGANSGIGRYANRLARAFSVVASEGDSFSLFYIDFLRSFRKEVSCPECAADPRFSFTPAHLFPARVYERAWNLPSLRPLFGIAPRDADLVHITAHAAVPFSRRQKMVCTIHDMAAWRFADHETMAKDRKAIRANALRADAIIADSRFTAADIKRFIPEAAGKIQVIHLGIDHDTFKPQPSEAIAAMRKALGLERPYLLSVGLVHPTKNHAFLGKVLDAIDRDDLELIISGAPSYGYDEVVTKLRSCRRASRIRLLGRIDDRWLPALYAGAEAYVTASRSEGFGFTPLEAMACGTPVVASAAGSLPEVLGDAATVIEEEDVDAWCKAVTRLLEDREFRLSRKSLGTQWVSQYTWRETAQRTLDVYRQVAGRR